MSLRQDIVQIKRVPYGAPVKEGLSAISEDGVVIIEDVLSPDLVGRLNRDLDPLLDIITHGADETADDFSADFWGRKTKRVSSLVTKSDVFRNEVLVLDGILEYMDLLLTSSDTQWLSTAQVIDIYPGESAQYLHRDLENYPVFRELGPAGPEVTVNCLIALTDFSDETGGTRVIPGSHKWADFNERGSPEMTIPVEMRAGSAVLYSGKVVHGGGANRSSKLRRALTMPYILGWLVPEEAYPFYVPVDLARTLPKRAQQMLGFRSFSNTRHHGGTVWQMDYKGLAAFLQMDADSQVD